MQTALPKRDHFSQLSSELNTVLKLVLASTFREWLSLPTTWSTNCTSTCAANQPHCGRRCDRTSKTPTRVAAPGPGRRRIRLTLASTGATWIQPTTTKNTTWESWRGNSRSVHARSGLHLRDQFKGTRLCENARFWLNRYCQVVSFWWLIGWIFYLWSSLDIFYVCSSTTSTIYP